ncbi:MULTISPECIES: hypothetical protein [Rhodopseudomonas]|uniref:Uncharacterized protein n=1 Tax=Rhodopseudomonas palustris TaxID=1076 RepID=A0A0D7F308_RHOPL|nr:MULTISPECIES: hypothetical protein [Rhodopseudomonas]KIZ47473.1 hypothetical protein OO17_04215 [Rhodopseudomonas palustris]MDF3814142.1 hypothetical protein [Rhodopseudomonas sp. BAL398]WOK15479.1 hypothetical protein RBJ75_14900 [Rhodopseudomonas sp. BAL398]
MADYYPLIARAIAGLDPSAPGEQRRALYERARSALIKQLRGVQPPLSESEITRERLSLEEAVRKVESEAAQRARDAARAEMKSRTRPGEAAEPRAGDSMRANLRPPPRPGDPPPQVATGPLPPAEPEAAPPSPLSPPPARPRPQMPSLSAPRNERPLGSDERDERPRNSRPDSPRLDSPRPDSPSVGMPDPIVPGRNRASSRRPDAPAGADQSPGIRGFRDVTADLADLGSAAAQANRQARKTYANVAPSPEFDRIEPSMENRGDPDAPYSYDESPDDAARYQPPQPAARPHSVKEKKPKRVGGAFPLRSAIVIGLVLVLVGAGILWGKPVYSSLRAMLASSSTPTAEPSAADSTPADRPKITDRVGQPSSEQVAPVAQRVVLYDEDPSDPKGKQYVGTVVWRTEQIKGASAKGGADLAVRADIDIPERKFKMTMSFRRNTDTSLPASHTAELTFILPPDFDAGGVSNVPGILMKSNEQARGTPLAGLAVKVTDGFFLVGLSNVEADRVRNLQLLKERSWFDVPLVYTNQRRAIIAIEKGAPGERVFDEAFKAWGE